MSSLEGYPRSLSLRDFSCFLVAKKETARGSMSMCYVLHLSPMAQGSAQQKRDEKAKVLLLVKSRGTFCSSGSTFTTGMG